MSLGRVSVGCGYCGWSTWLWPTSRKRRWIDRAMVRVQERTVLLHQRLACPSRLGS